MHTPRLQRGSSWIMNRGFKIGKRVEGTSSPRTNRMHTGIPLLRDPVEKQIQHRANIRPPAPRSAGVTCKNASTALGETLVQCNNHLSFLLSVAINRKGERKRTKKAVAYAQQLWRRMLRYNQHVGLNGSTTSGKPTVVAYPWTQNQHSPALFLPWLLL